jgi:hypothetical protein
VQAGDTEFRGKVTDLFNDTGRPLDLEVVLVGDNEWNRFHIALAFRDRALRIEQEEITSPTQSFPLYRVEHPAAGLSHDIEVAYNNFARGGKKPHIVASDQRALFIQLGTPARFDKNHEKAQQVIPATARRFREILGSIQFLDPEPSRMRTYTDTYETQLASDGRNLSGILFSLCKDPPQKKRLLDFICSLPEQDTCEIGFIETPRNEVMVTLTETFAGKSVERDATVLSDGTLRVLSVATAVLSAPEGSLLVIEEIDNGVHPSRAGLVLKNLEEVAKDRGISVLLSSHNPALLDSLPEGAVPNVVVRYRDPDEGDSRLVRLENLSTYPELVARGPIGTLMTRGILEKYVKFPKSDRQKEQEAQELLRIFEK